MKTLLLSVGFGFVVGLLYGAAQVKSPAPPIAALGGLLGMLAGEHAIGFARVLLARWL